MTSVHFPSENTQPGAATSVADILAATADLLDQPGAWTQGAFGRNRAGEDTGMSEHRGPAVCWCVLGATEKVDPDNSAAADEYLSRYLGRTVGDWNDAPERTQAEVVAALRAAAEKARTASAVGIGAADEPKTPTEQAEGAVLVSLAECPPGLFRHGDTLGFKSEYGAMEPAGTNFKTWTVGNQPDAYCADTGEYFWGGTKTKEDRAALMVEPVSLQAPTPASVSPGTEGGE